MKIPKKIKIGGKTFEIIIQDDVSAGITNQGKSSAWSQKIWLNSNQHSEAMEETLLHEIVELIQIENNLDINHQSISTLSVNLYQVLKDNNFLK